MARTLAEQIIAEHAGRDVRAGEYCIVKVDYCFIHDASGPLVIRRLDELGMRRPFDPKRVLIFIDHAVPSPHKDISNDQALLRRFAEEFGCRFFEAGSGICHQIVAEEFASPCQIIVGADSHTVTAGALGAFATGMGATDIAVALTLGKTWMRVPESYEVVLDGRLPKGVYGKDIALYLIGKLGSEGATYKCLEFQGKALNDLNMAERFTITNMVVEAGAKAGIMAPDDVTKRYLESMKRGENFREITSEDGAHFERTIEIKVDELEPQVALPHSVDNVKPVSRLGKVKVNEVFIGSC
ncbi:MAG: aconitase family protein, partial [Nitrososphaerota archaeon]